jgi:hypothetical protein
VLLLRLLMVLPRWETKVMVGVTAVSPSNKLVVLHPLFSLQAPMVEVREMVKDAGNSCALHLAGKKLEQLWPMRLQQENQRRWRIPCGGLGCRIVAASSLDYCRPAPAAWGLAG